MNGFFPSLLVHDTTLESGICFGVLSLLFSLVLVIIVFSICKLTNSTITMDDWFDAWKSESPRPKKTKEQKVKKVKKEKPLPIPTQKVEVKPLAIKPKNIPNSEFKILWIGAKNNPKFQALQQQGFSIIRLADVNQVNESDFPQKIASVGIVMGYYCGSAKARWQKLISISINECKCRFIMVVEPSKIGEAKVLYADHRYIVIPHTSSLQGVPVKDEPWSVVLVTYDTMEAEIIKDLLESGDIPVVLRSSKVGPYPVNVGKMGEIKILVRDEDKELAERVIREETDVE